MLFAVLYTDDNYLEYHNFLKTKTEFSIAKKDTCRSNNWAISSTGNNLTLMNGFVSLKTKISQVWRSKGRYLKINVFYLVKEC